MIDLVNLLKSPLANMYIMELAICINLLSHAFTESLQLGSFLGTNMSF
ncbi:hypothetical protein Cal6303_0440 [Calothrix sp. PCC 6303]|nr:hypothetical protein Cal6303_0440 [Calothrix sp. PCC 6303]